MICTPQQVQEHAIRVIKPRRERWSGLLSRIGREEVRAGFQWRKLREGNRRYRHGWEDNIEKDSIICTSK